MRAKLSKAFTLLLFLATATGAFAQLSISPATFPSAFVEEQLGTPPAPQIAIAANDSFNNAPFTWTLISGTLPPGLSLAATTSDFTTGALTGAIAAPGTFTYTLQVQDALGQTATVTYTTAVTTAPLGITPSTLSGGVLHATYASTRPEPVVTGGQAPYHWTLVSGTLPPGIALAATVDEAANLSSGALSGTPALPGTYSFTLQVTDSSPAPLTAIQTFSIGIANETQYPEPIFGAPGFVATGPDGSLWYTDTVPVLTDSQGNSLYGVGSITTAGVFNASYGLPQLNANGAPTSPAPLQIVTGSDGQLWFNELNVGSIGQISKAGVVGLQYQIPQTLGGSGGAVAANAIASGPDGAIWFTVYAQFTAAPYAAIGRIATTPDHTATYYPTTNTNPLSDPQGIVAGPDGALWFADSGVDQNGNPIGYIGRITTAGVLAPPPACQTSSLECPVGGSSSLNNLTAGPDGAIWFTDPIGNQIGRIASDGSTVNLYPVPTAGAGLGGGIVTGSDGALWFTENIAGNGQIGRITTAGVVTEFPSGYSPQGLTSGPDGAIWIADGSNIDSLVPPLALACNLASSLEVGSTLAPGVGCPAFGGTPSYTYTVSAGTLPAGLTLSPTTGAISGTPSAPGTYSFSILATDHSAPSETANQVISTTVAPRLPLSFSCSFPASAQVTVPYTATCTISGGIPPYTYSISAGTLPPGLTLTPTATGLAISGTPTAYGTFAFTIQAADSGTPQFTATQQSLAFTILPPPLTIACSFNAIAEVGVPYANSCTASGGIPPYTFSTTASAPAWLFVQDPAAGSFAGTPTAPGTSSFSVQVHDSGPPIQSVGTPVTLKVIPAKLGLMCDFTQIGVVGTAYATACVTTNGVSPYRFKISSGALPSGMLLNASTGAFSGKPSAAGVFPFTVQVSDNNAPSQTAIQNVNLKVTSLLLTIGSAALPDGAMDLPYSGNPLAEGGAAPYSWSVSAGALPAGLALNPRTGAITGTPTASGPYSFTLQATDSSALKQSASQAFTGTISVPVVQDFTEYSLPPGSAVSGIASGPDGALWFTTLNQPSGNLIGRIAVTGAVTTYPAPNPLNNTGVPGGIATGPDGTLWFPEQASDRIGQISTDGLFSIDYPITSSGAGPQQIVAGPDGALWFTESSLGQIGRISTSGIVLNEYPTPTPGSEPSGIAIGPDNEVWYTETLGNKIGRLRTAGSTPLEYAIPTSASLPSSLVLGPDGALWFTETGAAKIGRISQTGKITEFATPTPASAPGGIAAGADGALYFTETKVNQIGRITTDGAVTEYAVPTAASGLQGLTLGPDGAIWIAESAVNKIARFSFVTQLALSCNFPASTPVALGATYQATCTASRGVAPYTYTVSKGSLPPGVTLDPATGVLSGTVTGPGTFTFTVQAADSADPTQTAIQVSPGFTVLPGPLSLSCSLPPTGQTGTAYTGSCSASGGTAPYTYSLSAGTLPNGLVLDPAAGTIDGTPATPATFAFTVQVADSGSPVQTASQSATLAIQLGGSTGQGGLFTITGLPDTQPPATNLTGASLQLAQQFSVPVQGTVTLGFTPYAGDGGNAVLPDGYRDPAFQFVDSSGNKLGLSYNFTVPPGSTTVPLPAIDPGTVAGTIALTVATGQTIQASPSSFVPANVPSIEAGSVQFTNVTATGFDVEFIATDVTLEGTQATFTFAPAAGATLQGVTSFTVDVSQILANWYSSNAGLNNGGVFSLTVPFPLSGPASAIDSVTVTLGNSIGMSAPVSGKR